MNNNPPFLILLTVHDDPDASCILSNSMEACFCYETELKFETE